MVIFHKSWHSGAKTGLGLSPLVGPFFAHLDAKDGSVTLNKPASLFSREVVLLLIEKKQIFNWESSLKSQIPSVHISPSPSFLCISPSKFLPYALA